MKITPVKLIWESEFSALVRETYGRPYQLQQHGLYGEPAGQESMIKVSVPAEEEFEDEDPGQFEAWRTRPVDEPPEGKTWHYEWQRDLWWDREFYPPLEPLVNDMHARGVLPADDYVIHIWW